MSTSYSVHVGRYIKVKSLVIKKTFPKTIHVCSYNGCDNSGHMKDLGNVNFCFLCGSRIVPLETTETKNEYIDIETIWFDLFGDRFGFYYNGEYLFVNEDTEFSKSDNNDYVEINLIDMFEYMKNKTEDDAVDILSKHLTKIGVENEIKFGAVGYYNWLYK